MSNPAFDSQAFLATLNSRPGVYQMYDAQDRILYVGKARHLKNRLASYFRSSGLGTKTRALVSHIRRIEVTVTQSETEALLLEQNLIKSQKPPYNILLRDDKSYPYIFISSTDTYPAVRFHRGAKREAGRYFGPFPSGGAVRESLNLLQKLFRIRQCEESFFRNRSRPCLQHQIDRCTAPCVELISPEDYQRDLRHAQMFLEGKNQGVIEEIATQMEQAASALNFEKAAALRDQIQALRQVQEQQSISADGGEADIFGCALGSGQACVHALFVRGGRIIGSRVYYPKLALDEGQESLLSAFIAQFYFASVREIPPHVILPQGLEDQECLEQALSAKAHRKVHLAHRVRGDRAAWQRLAQTNAEQQLSSHLAQAQHLAARYQQLQALLALEQPIQRMECFDISHSSGEATVASCVVFDDKGPLKSDYRRFNIEGITPGDDYAAMDQALKRRYQRLKKGEGKLPDLLIIDGGKGQVSQALQVLAELQVQSVRILGIAKGPTRKAGFEVLIDPQTQETRVLQGDSPALHLLQQIRDEAHRFAITGHRARRGKQRQRSVLEDIPGVGAKRRRELLKYFGSVKEIENASVEEIAKVSTISQTLAQTIWASLHPDS
ncbi:excinuclease ABC subunit UvrC [Nitrincola tapanii]|uniref:UvrABC system protein C n=1 Tax=Nitrincola tapanii TaxID=1708751 RepID=A0A5A9W3U3_9GAMM|nr:excinuclease ABC subunit UvrC [Nitrincola tapanii]KAA0875440.1 excinuclease ABC subunit UvrC [Nitrincola tapanii]